MKKITDYIIIGLLLQIINNIWQIGLLTTLSWAIWPIGEYILCFLFANRLQFQPRITLNNRISNEFLFINLASITSWRFSIAPHRDVRFLTGLLRKGCYCNDRFEPDCGSRPFIRSFRTYMHIPAIIIPTSAHANSFFPDHCIHVATPIIQSVIVGIKNLLSYYGNNIAGGIHGLVSSGPNRADTYR